MRRSAVVAVLLFAASVVVAVPPPEAWRQPARYKFEYRMEPPVLPNSAEHVRIWLPYPEQTADQQVVSAEIESPWPYTVRQDRLGNRVAYFEGKGAPPGPVIMRFVVERRPSLGVPRADVTPGSPLDPQRYVTAQKLVPLDGVIRDLAVQASRGASSDAEKAQAFYTYVVRHMRYNKDGAGWGRGDAIWACTNKRGNCTDFHSLFMGMARSQGIPTRFIIGFPIPADQERSTIAGYHCWAQYYDATRGWVPLDASEANRSGWIDAYFGALPNDRIEFSSGRDLVLEPPQQGPPLNYFIYPYAEADGVPLTGVSASFRFERVPLAPAPL